MAAQFDFRLICTATLLMWLIGSTHSAVYADDVDRVRQLRSTDSILPLSKILGEVERRYPGTLLDVELEDEKDMIVYEIEVLGRDHIFRKIKIDAQSGKILASEQD